jgi:hypothetical protein
MSAAVYASMEDVAAVVAGGTAYGTAIADRLATAVILGTRHVDSRLGHLVGDEPMTGPLDSDDLEVVPADTRWRAATIVAATFFYKLPDIPFGVVGGWEYAVKANLSIPQVDAILGTSSWNIG